MKRFRFMIAVAVLAPFTLWAQSPDAVSVQTELVQGTSISKRMTIVETRIGDALLESVTHEETSTSSTIEVAVLTLKSKAPRLRVKCRTAVVKKIEDRKYAITEPGEHLVEILGIGLINGELFFEETEIRVKVGKGPNPPPDPDNVKNEYGVGLVAISAANFDQRNAKRIASIYRQSADFLFGKPTLKYLTSATDPNARNPNKSVFAWQNQQFQLIQTDIGQWRKAIHVALVESQRSRSSFTRQDWHSAFIEIATALEAIK